MFNKPDSSIPSDEWEALSSRERDFAHFIYEIYDHFDLVVIAKLGWKPTNIKITQGTNNIVIGFSYLAQNYIFRVPKYGIRQLKAIMCIRQQLNGKPYFPDILYYDDKCLIEQYADGKFLDELSDPNAFAKLASVMADFHSLPGCKFGPLMYKNFGVADDFQSYYPQNFNKFWDKMEQNIQFERNVLKLLKSHWRCVLQGCNDEPVICHGDLWHNNIFYSNDSKKITLIDWERCGVYHREKDLRFLLSQSITKEQRNTFLTHYPYEVNEKLMHWYELTSQLKYCRLEDIQNFINTANKFLSIMGESCQIINNSSIQQ